MAIPNIRVPNEVHERLKEWVRAEGRSLNDLAVEILDRESRRWEARQGLMAARRVREAIRQQAGQQPDSAPLIRALRDERGRYAG